VLAIDEVHEELSSRRLHLAREYLRDHTDGAPGEDGSDAP
jgi:hypothetical protein